ncbi:MAG: hypothetical protein ACK5LC_04620 [Coprobacillaceae bacterium]
MIDIILMIWSCLLTLSLFTSYVIYDITVGDTLAFFPIIMLLMGVIFLFLVNRKYKQMQKMTFVLNKGYENYVFYGTYIALFVIDLLIILGIYQNISLASPVLMSAWLLPMVCYSLYQSIWMCDDKAIHIALQRNVQEISYKKIRKIEITDDKKNKLKLMITTKKEEFTYKSKEKNILEMKEFLTVRCKDIKIIDTHTK